MIVLAIDPGTLRSAWLLWDGERPRAFGIDDNELLVRKLRFGMTPTGAHGADVVVIEKIESYGMAVGVDVFETVRWAARFEEASRPTPVVYLTRRAVKLNLCQSSRAKDANVRTALLDRFGGKAVAVGTKRVPGPLYGISKDCWSALAIAVTYTDGVASGAYGEAK